MIPSDTLAEEQHKFRDIVFVIMEYAILSETFLPMIKPASSLSYIQLLTCIYKE